MTTNFRWNVIVAGIYEDTPWHREFTVSAPDFNVAVAASQMVMELGSQGDGWDFISIKREDWEPAEEEENEWVDS